MYLLHVYTYSQETGRLLAKVQAQESVIEGLREERQLWGRELAHQGATLAQDRGRMEAQLEGLSLEVKTTREQLQREREALRIKEKQVHISQIFKDLLSVCMYKSRRYSSCCIIVVLNALL